MPFGPVRFSWHEALLKKGEGDAVSEDFFDVEKDIVHVESTRHHRNIGNLSVPFHWPAKTSIEFRRDEAGGALSRVVGE
ncbi:hypothetical protein D9M69_442280 [compost metagenome]